MHSFTIHYGLYCLTLHYMGIKFCDQSQIGQESREYSRESSRPGSQGVTLLRKIDSEYPLMAPRHIPTARVQVYHTLGHYLLPEARKSPIRLTYVLVRVFVLVRSLFRSLLPYYPQCSPVLPPQFLIFYSTMDKFSCINALQCL